MPFIQGKKRSSVSVGVGSIPHKTIKCVLRHIAVSSQLQSDTIRIIQGFGKDVSPVPEIICFDPGFEGKLPGGVQCVDISEIGIMMGFKVQVVLRTGCVHIADEPGITGPEYQGIFHCSISHFHKQVGSSIPGEGLVERDQYFSGIWNNQVAVHHLAHCRCDGVERIEGILGTMPQSDLQAAEDAVRVI